MINVDSTIHVEVVSAARASKILGVKRETLYAYASRGLLRRVPDGYLRADVERLKARSQARSGHGAVAAGALRWGEPVLDSAITSIDARGPAYRGRVAVDLATSGKTFEQVAELLWTGALPDDRPRWKPLPPTRNAGSLASLTASAHPIARLGLLVPALALSDPAKLGAAIDAERGRARGLIARMAAPFARREHVSIARAFELGEEAAQALDLALVVIADHELNASSFAARVAASAGADLYACVSAALATASGPFHAGECDRVEVLVREKGGVHQRTRRGEVVPGFGHPLYPGGDPRATPLLDAARSISAKRTAAVFTVVRAAKDALGVLPTVDVGLVALASALGMGQGSAAGLFALGRTAGWVAHVLEQREAGFLLRPRARYTGTPAP